MRNNLNFIIGAVVLIIFFAAVAFAASRFYQGQSEKRLLPSPQPTPVSGFETASPSPPVLGQADIPGIQPESGSNTLVENNIKIFIESPSPSSIISSPLKIKGYTALISTEIKAQIKDANNNIIGKNHTNACINSSLCSFEIEVFFNTPQTATGLIEIYVPALDGLEGYRQNILTRFR